MAYLVEAVDLLGRAQMLQAQTIDPTDPRAVDTRRDASRAMTSSAERWFVDMPLRRGPQTPLSLLVVSCWL